MKILARPQRRKCRRAAHLPVPLQSRAAGSDGARRAVVTLKYLDCDDRVQRDGGLWHRPMVTPEPASLASSRAASLPRVAALVKLDIVYVFLALQCLGLLGAFALVPYLPMVDLPQHAAQISIWFHDGQPPFLPHEDFAVNLRTPYLGAYLLARGLAEWFGILPALKGVVWLSIVLQVVAFAALVQQLRYPRWLALLGLPLGLGYGFYFGFISYNLALPLVLFSISAALQHRERCSWQTGLLLAGTLSATLACHGFALGVGMAMVSPPLLRGAGRLFARLAPLLAPPLIALVWLVPGPSIQSVGATVWAPRLLELTQVPARLVGVSSQDIVASSVGVGLLALLGLTLLRPRRPLEMAAPLVFVLGGYCLFPAMQSGFGPLHPRFAAFVVPALLLAFEPRRAPRWPHLPKLAFALCAGWFGIFAVRLVKFSDETRPVAALIADLPAGLSVRPIVFERGSRAFPGVPALLHLSAYYAAQKGGFQGYSFAVYPTSVVLYTESAPRGMWGGAEWQPERFSATDELSRYDVFWVKSSKDRTEELFGAFRYEVSLVLHQRDFWVYRR